MPLSLPYVLAAHVAVLLLALTIAFAWLGAAGVHKFLIRGCLIEPFMCARWLGAPQSRSHADIMLSLARSAPLLLPSATYALIVIVLRAFAVRT